MNEVRLPDLFDLELGPGPLQGWMRPWRTEGPDRAPQIRLDVNEGDESYTVKADIPGVRKEDIDVRIDGNQVTISAEVKEDKEEKKNGRVLRSERRYGYASRSFMLGSDVDDANARASYDNGVLQLLLPKKARSGGSKVQVA